MQYHEANWAVAEQGFISAANFVTTLLIARELGIDEFGRFTLAWMATLFIASLNMALIASPMMAIGPKQSSPEEPAYYGSVVIQHLVFSVGTSVVLGLLIALSGLAFPEWGAAGLALPVALATLTHQSQECLRRYFFTRCQPAKAFFNSVCRFGLQVASIALVTLLFSPSTADALFLLAAAAAISVIAGALQLGEIRFEYNNFRTTLARHWASGKWLAPSALLEWGAGNLMIIISGAMLGTTAVGALRATSHLMGLAQILALGLNNAVQPQASRTLQQEGHFGLHRYLLHMGGLGTIAITLLLIVACAAPTFWIGLLYGDEFEAYSRLIWLWAPYYVLMFLSIMLYIGLRSLETTLGILISRILAVITSASLAVPLITLWDTNGAIVSAILSMVVLVATLAFSYRRALHQKSNVISKATN